MRRGLATGETITVPSGEFWKGTLFPGGNNINYKHSINDVEMDQGVLAALGISILASGTVIKAGGLLAGGANGMTINVLRFSEV